MVSSAADNMIFIYDVNTGRTTHELPVHRARVKRLTVSPDSPYLFWSSGEDGFVLQHDIRCPANDMTRVFISYPRCLSLPTIANLEVKCLAINPARTEFLAVGCNDPYARIYDRRMVETQPYNARTVGPTERGENDKIK
jgi:WD and tetratricopeptide repeat-containing protein 1